MSLESMFSLAPRKALIAGASRGIGLAIAKAFGATRLRRHAGIVAATR